MTGFALPADISIAGAKLPRSYEHAKQALAACINIDECWEWANKMEALASYAKQSDDETLFKHATRIRARAVRRCGELLKLIEPSKGGRPAENPGAGRPSLEGWIPGTGQREPSLDGWIPGSRTEAADAAGLTEHRKKQALRVATVSSEKFEEWVEAETPVSVAKLAEAGRQPRQPSADHLQGRDPEQFSAATHTMGAMRRFAEKCGERDAEYIAAGVLPSEVAEARRLVASIDAWLDRFVVNLKG